MKPISECKWDVKIEIDEVDDDYWWYAETKSKSGMSCNYMVGNDYKTPRGAINNWKKFAEINGIKNYKIKE